MKKSPITIIAVIGIGLILVILSITSYNGLVNKDEAVSASWSQVENVYKRRADLIPNLVSTVKGYADFEKSTLIGVIEARSKATSVTVDPTNLNGENVQQFLKAQEGLSSALSRLMLVVERYPDLKANQNFMDLQQQLEKSENRITVERRNFIGDVKDYNMTIRRFPGRIFAGLFGFEKKDYFQAQEGDENAPNVGKMFNSNEEEK